MVKYNIIKTIIVNILIKIHKIKIINQKSYLVDGLIACALLSYHRVS